MTGALAAAGAEKGIPCELSSPATVSGACNYVTDASWEGAVGDEAKPGDLPVAKPVAYGG